MAHDRAGQVKKLLDSLAQCDPEEQQERLRVLRADDPELCNVVEDQLRDSTKTQSLGRNLLENLDVLQYPPNALIAGRYRLERQLARGGFGVVYRARDERLHDKPVVVKFLACEDRGDEWFRKKFRDEIQALSLIDHPGVVGILDAGADSHRNPFLVIQYIAGVTLQSLIRPEGMQLELVARIIRQIGQALAAAHSRGVFHRDLKPANVMVQPGPGGEIVRLIDFGIATILQGDEPGDAATRVVGTLAYMAPEQFRGQPTGVSDIFAMGVIAWEMLVGKVPFGMSLPEVLSAQRRGPRADELRQLRPDVPEAAVGIICKALSTKPEHRFQSASELGNDLARALTIPASRNAYVPSPGDPLPTTQQRALDVAMARQVPIHKPAEVVALIRRTESGGLTAVLRMDDDYSVRSEDVRSKAFELEFPVDQVGRLRPLELGLRIECPDFEPAVSLKTVLVPPTGDSDACTFLITPQYLGEVRVNVEVIRGDVLIASRTLKTEATTSDREIDSAKVLVSIPLSVVVRDSRDASMAAAGSPATEQGVEPRSLDKIVEGAPPAVPKQGPEPAPPAPDGEEFSRMFQAPSGTARGGAVPSPAEFTQMIGAPASPRTPPVSLTLAAPEAKASVSRAGTGPHRGRLKTYSALSLGVAALLTLTVVGVRTYTEQTRPTLVASSAPEKESPTPPGAQASDPTQQQAPAPEIAKSLPITPPASKPTPLSPPKAFVAPSQGPAPVSQTKEPQLMAGLPPTIRPATSQPVAPSAIPPPATPVQSLPAKPAPSVDVEAIQQTLGDFAAAFSRKDVQTVLSLWPNMPNANGIRDFYQVRYTLRTTGAPVITGEQAQVTAQRSTETVYQQGGPSTSVTDTVSVMLTKTGGHWTITDMLPSRAVTADPALR